jgi:fructosamine-3-kinase
MFPPALLPPIHAALEAAGEPLPIRSYEMLKGGYSSHSLKIMARRGVYLLKWHEQAEPDTYVHEARGLEALRQAGVVRVPAVLAAARPAGDAPGFLLQEWIPTRKGGWPRQMNQQLGATIARLHRAGMIAPGYARVSALDHVGDEAQGWTDWVTCYREHYLVPSIQRKASQGLLSTELQHGLARLLERLEELLGGVARQPALIHGDLWRNNVLCDTKDQPVLIDPHAAYADREYELMIAEEYGGFGPSFFAAYEATWPTEPGRAERRALYQLHSLIQRLGARYSSTPDQIAAIVQWYVGR